MYSSFSFYFSELDSLPGAQYALFGYQQNGKSARSFKVKNLTECIEKARTSPGEPANQITMENPYIEKDTYNCWANGRATGVRYYEEKYVSIFIEPRKIWPGIDNISFCNLVESFYALVLCRMLTINYNNINNNNSL